jgi:hypothetical protein
MADPYVQIKNAKGRTQLQLDKELVLGTLVGNAYLSFVGKYIANLPQYIDDAERDFGTDIYERMLRDPALSSSVTALKQSIMAEGPRFHTPIQPPSPTRPDPDQQAKYDKGQEICAFIERMFDRLQSPLDDILYEMLDFLSFGHTVAEEVYAVEDNALVLKTLRIKPRQAYAFVVDKFFNHLGFTAAKEGASGLSPLLGVISETDVIPREKFFCLTYAPKCSDPRGTSILRPAYNAWYLKQQTWPQYLKFLAQFGTPSIALKLPPDAEDVELYDGNGVPVTDSDGRQVVLTPEEAYLQKVIAFTNGTAIVLPNGADLDLIQSTGDGEAYVKAISLYNQEMVKSVLNSTRATMEAEFGSRADSNTGKDIFDTVAQWLKRKVEAGFYRDVIRPLVVYNYGEEIADEFCPFMTLTQVAREDVAKVGAAIAQLASAGLIDVSQYQGIWAMLSLPEGDIQSMIEEATAKKERAAEIQRNGFGVPGLGEEV